MLKVAFVIAMAIWGAMCMMMFVYAQEVGHFIFERIHG